TSDNDSENNDESEGETSDNDSKENDPHNDPKGEEQSPESEEADVNSEESDDNERKKSHETEDDEQDEVQSSNADNDATIRMATFNSTAKNITGVAKKSPTNVREDTSTKSKIIKQFSIGQVIEYKDHSKNWNQITVNVNGKQQIGFIHKKHV